MLITTGLWQLLTTDVPSSQDTAAGTALSEACHSDSAGDREGRAGLRASTVTCIHTAPQPLWPRAILFLRESMRGPAPVQDSQSVLQMRKAQKSETPQPRSQSWQVAELEPKLGTFGSWFNALYTTLPSTKILLRGWIVAEASMKWCYSAAPGGTEKAPELGLSPQSWLQFLEGLRPLSSCKFSSTSHFGKGGSI